jgi:hypothetical protein
MVTPERHVALVDHLVRASQPVRRLWPVRARFAVWLACGTAVGVMFARVWARPDLALKLHDRTFVLGLGMLGAASALATMLALRSAVPGRAPTRIETAIVLVMVAAAAMSFWAPATSGLAARGWPCCLWTLALAAGPWAALLVAIRRGAPLHDESAAAFAGGAALLFATALLRTACVDDGPVHWLTWHLGTAAVATLGSAPIAAAWLRTWRNGHTVSPIDPPPAT